MTRTIQVAISQRVTVPIPDDVDPESEEEFEAVEKFFQDEQNRKNLDFVIDAVDGSNHHPIVGEIVG